MIRLLAFALVMAPCAASGQGLPDALKGILRAIPQQRPAQQPQPAAPHEPGLFGSASLEEEVAIGRQLAGNLLGAVPLVRDDRLQRYVSRVGRWIASQGERPELEWHFGVLDSGDVNAFALPGGYVFVTLGLMQRLSSEAELAGVLGHEIGHVLKRHHLEVLKKSQLVGIASNLIGQQVSRERGGAAVQQLIGKGAEALARGLDKDAEYEADRIGVVLATRAGYEPLGLPRVLAKLAQMNPREESLALLFKTHPLPQDRLAQLGDAMGDAFDRYGDGKLLAERFRTRGARP
jgi:predicted Zn-dependent protease